MCDTTPRDPVRVQQFVVGTALADLALVIDDQALVRFADGRQPVGDEQ